jgi:hypothetical protein
VAVGDLYAEPDPYTTAKTKLRAKLERVNVHLENLRRFEAEGLPVAGEPDKDKFLRFELQRYQSEEIAVAGGPGEDEFDRLTDAGLVMAKQMDIFARLVQSGEGSRTDMELVGDCLLAGAKIIELSRKFYGPRSGASHRRQREE